jgi:hypothetical protein
MGPLKSPDELLPDSALIRRMGEYRQDLEKHARECLKIRNKRGELVPLLFNPLQRMTHRAAEQQKSETGRVRAIVLKYRRGGASTYILGRGYSRSTLHHGVSVAIMAHVSQSTNALYRIVKRFQDNNPIAPPLLTSNVKGLEFAGMDSRYGVFSAENEEGGRGDEVSFLHVSEAAYAPNLEGLMSGIGNCVSDEPGTEIWLESTAKEPFGDFYDRCMDSLAGAGEYKLIFVPFTEDPGCAIEPPPGFEPEFERDHEAFPSEVELMDMQGLTLNQIAWRRRKMGGKKNIIKFSREYPITVSDCFSAIDDSAFISPIDIIRARSADIQPSGAVVIGIDPSGEGKDRFVISVRQGRKVKKILTRTKVKFNEGLEWIKAVIEDEKPDRVNIDCGGGGNGSAYSSALRDDPRYAEIVRGVNFGSTSQSKLARPDQPGPVDRKAEMAKRVKDALESIEGLDLPDQEDVQSDFCSVKVEFTSPEGDFRLVPKKKLKTRSHDFFDSVGLTFADAFVQPINPVDGSAVNGQTGGTYAPAGIPPASTGWMS